MPLGGIGACRSPLLGKKVSGWLVLSLTGLESPNMRNLISLFPMIWVLTGFGNSISQHHKTSGSQSMLSQLPPLWGKYARCSLLDLVLCMSADAGSILCLPALGQKSGILLICADRISVVLHAPCGRDWGPFGWVLMGLAGWQLQQLGAVGYLSTSQAWSVSIDSYS